MHTRSAESVGSAIATFYRSLAGHRGRGVDALQCTARRQTFTQTAHQHRKIGALTSAVGVQLVEYQEFQTLTVGDDLECSCRVSSSSSIMKFVSRTSGGDLAIASRVSLDS
jgi:hypothetical protein